MDMINNEPIVNEYFPELDGKSYKSKYGILNIGLIKNKNVASGYQWNYIYYDIDCNRTRFIHSYDLRIVREKVLELGGEWIITDSRKAIESYKFNNELVKKHDEYLKDRKYRGTSGVNHVTIQRHNGKDYGNYWVYRYNNINCCDKNLTDLKKKVIELGGEWVVKDNDLYEHNIKYNNSASNF